MARVRIVASNQEEEATELVGLCLWDNFSDNHDVITADGRVAEIGSFRGAGAFLDEYVTRDQEGSRDGHYMWFYMGNNLDLPTRRADAVYAVIFRCLKAGGRRMGVPLPGNPGRRGRTRGRRRQSGQ